MKLRGVPGTTKAPMPDAFDHSKACLGEPIEAFVSAPETTVVQPPFDFLFLAAENQGASSHHPARCQDQETGPVAETDNLLSGD